MFEEIHEEPREVSLAKVASQDNVKSASTFVAKIRKSKRFRLQPLRKLGLTGSGDAM